MIQSPKKLAAVDTDFANKLAESRIGIKNVIEKLTLIFGELKLDAIVHPLLYENELFFNNKAEITEMFLSGVLRKIDFIDIFNEDDKKILYYKYIVSELYNVINGEPFPFSDEEILIRWQADKSLGEVHTLSMCMVIDCGIFLSDDNDSKKLSNYIQLNLGGNIVVYDRKELVEKHVDEGVTSIIRRERQSLTHA